MNTRFFTTVLPVLFLAAGTMQAYADSGWQYDNDSDTINFSYSGVPATPSARHSDAMNHAGAWHYVADTDTIVFTGVESRSGQIGSGPSTGTFEFDSELSFLDQ